MARKGEERAVPIAMTGPEDAVGLVLEGLFLGAQGSGGAVIAPPHPLYGGSMDSPVVSELAWACGRAGLSSLRFNWRGVGASGGAPSGELADAEGDVVAAVAHLADTVPGDLVGCGYSYGAVSVARVAPQTPRMRRLVLVAPPAELLGEDTLGTLDAAILLLAGAHDAIALPHRLRTLTGARSRASFVEIEEADHFFGAGLVELGAAVTTWLQGK